MESQTRAKLLIIIFILAGSMSIAQDQNKKMQFSLEASPHLSWLKSDLKGNETGPVSLGYTAGVEFDYFFEKHYAFSTGINLHRTGGSLTYAGRHVIHFAAGADTMAPGTKMTYQLQYIDIPLGLKFTSTEVGYTTIFADVGLNLMINTKASATSTDNNYVKEPLPDEIGLFNVAYHVEAGFMYSFGNNLSFIVGVQYLNSFLDLTKDLGAPATDNVHINQVALKLGLAF